MQVVNRVSVAVANKDIGEVYYKAKTVLYLALVKVSSNRDNYYTIKCHLEVN